MDVSHAQPAAWPALTTIHVSIVVRDLLWCGKVMEVSANNVDKAANNADTSAKV